MTVFVPMLRRAAAMAGLVAVVAAAVGAAAEPANDAGGAGQKPTPEALEFFEKQVRPLLAEQCWKCHGAKTQKGGLRLDSRAGLLAGGETGPVVVPGKPAESLLVDAVDYGELYQMPPTGKLPDERIAVLRRWVELGAPWPDETSPTNGDKNPAAFDLDQRARHWAFQPPVEHSPPSVRDAAWARSPVDRFILARLEAAGLAPAGPADRPTLLRRVTFDLVGLSPAPAEAEAFLADDSPRAFERVVDRLLASPHFGERWARHWLDLVRYAETRGHEFDYPIPNAYQYRDYCTRALNADLPYNQFVLEHLAGDLLPAPRLNPQRGFNESILGTGFWFLGEEVHSPVDVRSDETDRTDNKLDVLGKAFLGLTVACARCHDHKFDAISTRDYYALAGFVISSSYRQVPFDVLEQNRRVAEELAALRTAQRPHLERAAAAMMRPTLAVAAQLLLAARDALRSESSGATSAAEQQNAVAAQHDLDSAILAAWVAAVRQAASDPRSPLQAWALFAVNPAAASPAELLRPTVDALRAAATTATHSLDAARMVIDYSHARPADWIQDGFAFAPVRPGELRFGDSAERPVAAVFDRAAAVYDPLWNVQQPAAGNQVDGGRLSWLQAGRTLRTPTFTIGSGKLYYLVSGSGYAYAAVDSHRMNNGPLHAALVRRWQAGDGWQWIEHNLSDYQGHRVHIEFSPQAPGELKAGESPRLAIALVVEADHTPPVAAPPNGLLLETWNEANLASAESLAGATQKLLVDAVERFAGDGIVGAERANDWAAVVDWLMARSELFGPPEVPARRQLADVARPLLDAQARLAASIPREVHTAPALLDGSGVDEYVLLRGNAKTPGEAVPRRYLEALAGREQPPIEHGSGRLELARRITDPAHPLVARVMVNRVWQHLFGRGIVPSVDNFGVLGEPPTHPELFDYLAERFVAEGWSIKQLIRTLVLSSTYQMSSRPSDPARQVDPRNRLWQHVNVRRLEAEAIRDAILAVSGRLDEQMFGPSVPVYLTPFMEGRGRPESGPLDGNGRRSLYIGVRRNFLSSMFLAFDYPIPLTTAGRRSVSNVPAQALMLMNSPLVVAEARRWAERMLAEAGLSPPERIQRLYLAAFARQADRKELDDALGFVAEQSRRYGGPADDPRAWADLCHVLLNVKEFIFIE